MYIYIADSFCCTVESNTTLKSNDTPIKITFENRGRLLTGVVLHVLSKSEYLRIVYAKFAFENFLTKFLIILSDSLLSEVNYKPRVT